MIKSELIGNSDAVARLSSMFDSDKLPHALLIEGPIGSGRRTLAGVIARTAVCTGDDAPCGLCSACISGSSNPDITVVKTDKSNITVDVIRTVRNNAFIKPNQSARRVFIIPEAQLMNVQAQNALLKVLEEPPVGVLFILTCEYAGQLLETVVSRLSVISLRAPERNDGIDYICSRYPQFGRDEVERAYETTVGAALDILNGSADYILNARKAVEAMLKSELELHKFMHEFEKNRTALKAICSALTDDFRDALAVRMGADRGYDSDDVRVILAKKYTPDRLIRLGDIAEQAVKDCDTNMGGVLFTADLCARLCFAVE